jgi:hypothetical protein
MNGEYPYCETAPEMDKLKRAAFEVLRDNEGCECQDWINILVDEYGKEVVDAFDDDPFYVNSQLSDYWDCMDYEDPDTGICFTYRDWAEYFINWEHREVYDKLVEVSRKLDKIKLLTE